MGNLEYYYKYLHHKQFYYCEDNKIIYTFDKIESSGVTIRWGGNFAATVEYSLYQCIKNTKDRTWILLHTREDKLKRILHES